MAVVGLFAMAAWACGGGGLVEAPTLPSGAKFAVLPASEDAGDATASVRRPATSPLREGEVFRGTSYCRMGQVTVVLRVAELDADDVRGTVELSTARGGARGVYQVSGTYTTQTHRLKLEGGDWVDESDELEAADIEGTLTAVGLQGRISMGGCGSLSLKREGAP
jgi:hypothetical protein